MRSEVSHGQHGGDVAVTTVLGLSAGFHDAAAAVIVDGRVVAAVEEERISRVKHDPAFPARAADTCMAIAGCGPEQIDLVVFHEKPLDVVGRHLNSRLRAGPSGVPALVGRTPNTVAAELGVGRQIRTWFADRGASLPPVWFSEHHVSHAAAAFYPSPFDAAAVMTVDGVGESVTSTIGVGRERRLQVDCELRYPDSLGLLYSAFTAYCGFRVNGGEGELMGLAPFGVPRFADVIREELVDQHDDGSLRLQRRYFAFDGGRRATNRRFHELFGGPPQPLGAVPTQREADLAASVQVILEDALLAMAREVHGRTGLPNLCLGGGVALNCVANGRLRRDGPFENVWVQPAAGDAGNAVGAALWAWHEVLGNERLSSDDDRMGGAFLGPSFSRAEVHDFLDRERVAHRCLAGDELLDEAVAHLAAGDVVGWFQGRMEFGPRALGHRSILADARSPHVQQRLNEMVKERATFRPFAPAVLARSAADWFDPDGGSPYMTFVGSVASAHLRPDGDPGDRFDADDLAARVARVRSTVPAVTHVDGSARVQLVDVERNPEFAALLERFHDQTGCPVLLNTSFNARDEPIVCSPADALATFRRTGLDVLIVEGCVVTRDDVGGER